MYQYNYSGVSSLWLELNEDFQLVNIGYYDLLRKIILIKL